MKLQELFIPRLSKKNQKAYKSKELDKRIRELTEAGYVGLEYKNKVYQAKKELEREIKNGIIRKYYKPTGTHKQIFQTHILKHNLLPLFRTSDNIHYLLSKTIKTDNQFTVHISKQDLFSKVFPEFKRFDVGDWQTCIFTKDNVGWITRDNDGYYRYCTKSVKTGVIFGFSLFDLIEITYSGEFVGTGMAYQMARKWLAKILNVSYRDLDYVNYQKKKYQSNQTIIDEASEWESLYPNLYSLIKSQLYILEELHHFASQHITERRHAIKNEAVFFISVRHIAKLVNERLEIKKHPTTFSAAINLFAVLHLLQKVPSETLNYKGELLQIAHSIQGNNNHFHLITFMTIPSYDEELLIKAEKMAKRLRKHKITTAKQITFNSLAMAIGDKKANAIINVREVSLAKIHADKLAKLAEEALRDFPYEAFEKDMEKSMEEITEIEPNSTEGEALSQLDPDEEYEMALQHFEQQEEENEFGDVE